MSKQHRIKIGVMGSAADLGHREARAELIQKGEALAVAIAKRDCLLLTGATTGIVYLVGKAAHDAGTFHIGVSPGSSKDEHIREYKLPIDACDAIVYTGFGLKGRNVVLVRSCDIVLFVAGAMGSLNEFTIAYDEGKVIGCLMGSGGVADEADYIVEKFGKRSKARVFKHDDPDQLIEQCIASLQGKKIE
jgi:uncharacterized protein (TIGR00725 family)